MRLSRALKEKQPQYEQRHDKVILQHDNARPHVAQAVKKYLETLKWEVLPHPSYSPDLAPSDDHLFRSMTHGLAEQHFRSYEETEKWVDSWIASKPTSFFRKLPERWEKVVVSDGQHFECLHCNRFFAIKPQIWRKNRTNLFVPLLVSLLLVSYYSYFSHKYETSISIINQTPHTWREYLTSKICRNIFVYITQSTISVARLPQVAYEHVGKFD